MCVGVCITRRGMVYFGASIHIFITFILFVGSSIRAFRLTTYEKENIRKEVLGGFVIAAYFFILLMLGCLIFRATEQRNAKLLGWSGGIFITLETIAFVFNLLLLSPAGSSYDEYGFRNFGFKMNLMYIVLSTLCLGFMMAYCSTIIRYISQLREGGGGTSSSGYHDGAEEADEQTESSRNVSTFFSKACSTHRSAPTAPTSGAFNILEVVKEAKRQQQLKEQKELREKQRISQLREEKAAKGRKGNIPQEASQSPGAAAPNHVKSRKPSISIPKGRPHIAQPLPKSAEKEKVEEEDEEEMGVEVEVVLPPPGSTTPEAPPPQKQQPSHVEQTTQTPPSVPYHGTRAPPPNLHPHQSIPNSLSSLYSPYSQTLPPRRSQPMLTQQQGHWRPYFEGYTQRGILSAPSFASMINTATASIIPHRVRNPSSSLRTTKSGTLLSRYGETVSPPPPPPPAPRLSSLQRQRHIGGGLMGESSGSSSFDPMLFEPPPPPLPLPPVPARTTNSGSSGGGGGYEADCWDQASRVAAALKQYGGGRRGGGGGHKNDYGFGLEV